MVAFAWLGVVLNWLIYQCRGRCSYYSSISVEAFELSFIEATSLSLSKLMVLSKLAEDRAKAGNHLVNTSINQDAWNKEFTFLVKGKQTRSYMEEPQEYRSVSYHSFTQRVQSPCVNKWSDYHGWRWQLHFGWLATGPSRVEEEDLADSPWGGGIPHRWFLWATRDAP